MASEGSLKATCCKVVTELLPGAHVQNIQDRWVSGRPDTTVTYDGPTTFLEFKFLGATEKLHGPLRKDQLEELIALQHASAGRAWVVVYRKGGKFTDIYQPSALRRVVDGELETFEPEPVSVYGEMLIGTLRVAGVIRCVGHNHRAVATLIRLTHEGY